MGDSDDEYDRRRGRDKFRRERNDYSDRNMTNRRDDWSESWSATARNDRNPIRRDYRDSYNNLGGRVNYARNDRYSPADRTGDISPTNKRMRTGPRDWDERFQNYDTGGGYHSGGHHGHFRENWPHDRGSGGDRDDESHQPPMMTLKQFVNEQDDHLDGELLIAKYNEYRNEFKRTQLQEFFNRHKDEEWFRCKYYPDEIEKRKAKSKQAIQKRVDVFMELYNSKWMDDVSMDVDKAEQIIKLFDAVVIKLEGGTDFDLLSLNTDVNERKVNDPLFAVESSSTTKASFSKAQTSAEKGVDGGEDGATVTAEKLDDNNTQIPSNLDENSGEIKEENDDEQNGGGKMDKKGHEEEEDEDGDGEKSNTEKEDAQEERGDGEIMEEGEDVSKDGNDSFQPMATDRPQSSSECENEKKPRALHKTCSIFFRNLAPSITRQEIEDECRKFPGFLRLAISEPQMDRRFNRRGWATYERTVNIREICWNLNNIKIRGTELSPIVNRDLTRRIRSVSGISAHKSVVRADIRHAAKLVMKLDQQKKLWMKEENSAENEDENASKRNGSMTTPSLNPLLKNITDYLIEEASAEEAELLGTSVEDPLVATEMDTSNTDTNGNATTTTEGTQMERDEDLIKVLDRLVFYLRVVHSIDYYNHCEYPNEDEMPNRIGLVHARGLISSARVSATEIADYIKDQENKIKPLLQPPAEVTPEEAKKLGLKDIDEAVDAFIQENTKDLGEGKWLCPLSNKKFMGPVFVQKHILNKHMERVEQVKAETQYFNNYILDPKRPQLPEHPLNRPPQSQQQQQNPLPQQPQHQFPMMMMMGGGGGGRHDLAGGYGGYNPRGGNHMPGLLGQRYMPPPPPLMDAYMRPNLKRRESQGRDAVDYDDVAFEELI